MKSTISFYITIFFRRIHLFLIVFLLVTAGALTVAKILPPVYVSQSRLLVESSQIPNALAAPTVQVGAAEELQIIEQQLMTRVNLLKIARAFDAFENIDQMTADQIVRDMRNATGIRRAAGRGQATLMTISFSSDNGLKSANIVNEYVTKILQANTESRISKASSTLEFFQTTVDRLGNTLQEQSAEITKFKNANIDSLPDTLTYRLNQQTVLQDRLSSVERQLSSLNEQRRSLVEIYNATGKIGAAAGTPQTPEQRALQNLQDQLRTSLAIFSPEHPTIKILEAQVRQQEAVVAAQTLTPSADPQSPTSLLDINLAGLDAQISILEAQETQISEQLAVLKRTIEQTPANTIQLGALNRDYQNIQLQYNTAVSSLSQASMGERIELLSKGQRIAILDPATVPDRPASPNRTLIATGGAFVGALLGLGLILGLELLNSSIRRPTEIVKHLGITPIATIPYVRTPLEQVIRRATFVGLLVAILVGVPATLFVVHTYYMPLDLIYDRIADKVSSLI